MDPQDIIVEAYRFLQPRNDPPQPKRPGLLHCEICNSQDVRLVSGGKYRCLMCGFLPS